MGQNYMPKCKKSKKTKTKQKHTQTDRRTQKDQEKQRRQAYTVVYSNISKSQRSKPVWLNRYSVLDTSRNVAFAYVSKSRHALILVS